jgi:DNA ligase
MHKLDVVVKQGGEGLMLHLETSFYHALRSDELLKLKQYYDAEARVIEHIPGRGKYQGMLGSMLVEMSGKPEKRLRFRIGTGFSDAQRQSPPSVGALITYKYFGLTSNGLPRFASFMRIRDPM